ncbi:nucleotide-diphospho-sugar transferase [Ilyonectria sp. MPI-CAGE-AT-0026]|nr:nucleotide-diphospho-sugar transferase [Ilyonectria sp. MPI-CAGE-AT-0026]
MTFSWKPLGQSPAESADFDTPRDEERLGCEVPYRQFPRLRRIALWLLLTDLVLVALLLHTLDPLITLLRRNEELFGARLALSGTDNPKDSNHQDKPKIPRILHQTCANETIPEKWVDSQQSCKEAYSDFEYKLWTDQSAREFIYVAYPWFLETWDNYDFPIQRADSIRYFVLHHYGGIYLDMDTLCNETFPLHQVESAAEHQAIFKSTLPTGVTNDFMISSAGHPAFAAAIAKLPTYYNKTRLWARLLPYGAIMISSGPFFLTMMVMDYLMKQPLLSPPTVQVVNQTQLAPYITDLESCTWHQEDAQLLMWLGERPWAWFSLGGIGLVAGIYLTNCALMSVWKTLTQKASTVTYNTKSAKLV